MSGSGADAGSTSCSDETPGGSAAVAGASARKPTSWSPATSPSAREGALVADPEARPRRAQHVGEPCARDVRVEERADRAQLRDGAERDQEERAVGTEDGDRLPGTQPGACQHRGQAIHPRVVRAVGDRFRFELECDAIGNALGLLPDEATERIGRSTELGDDLSEVHRHAASRPVVGDATFPGCRFVELAPCEVPGSEACVGPQGVSWRRRRTRELGARVEVRQSARRA